ncbi:MAG: hypothetical protein GAK28_03937 [Luteibacter sp.]|uniref:GFA family protein n=1 Tax=Luteibacter sp. TaxID=1886636 RepID=UPI001382A509|nr:GFA family protein [Luteibacter sp.]KAF1004560.1 MAG: hypothetical protein GAK28_03937 [Luteibacter sp.]
MLFRTTCLCGKVSIELHGEPSARANCHCSSCRDFYGVPLFSATAWQADNVRIDSGATRSFKHPEKDMTKTFCENCGEVVFGTNRLGMRVVPNAMVARATDGSIQEHWAPTMHLFYRQRLTDIQDNLPKYLEGWDGPLL